MGNPMGYSPLRSILAATDLTPVSDTVVRQAAAMAARAGAALHVVHVVEGPPSGSGHAPNTAMLESVRRAEALLHEQLRRCARDVRTASRGVQVGVPHMTIVASAQETAADVIVIGPHGGRRFRARFLGTTADRVLREADVPCLVVRSEARLPWRRIAVPTDLKSPVAPALSLALGWTPVWSDGGSGEPPEILLVHVGWSVEREDGAEPRLLDALRREAERASVGATVQVRTELLWANEPTGKLIRWASKRRIDLIVVPTTGIGGVRRVLLGSFSSALARQAPCSVLMLPGAAASDDKEPALQRVVIGADFSEPSNTAAAWTTRHLAPDAEHVIVHAIDVMTPPSFIDHGTAARAELVEGARAVAQQRLQELTSRLGLREPRVELIEGRAAAVLSDAAREQGADLIVVGEHTHPRGIWGVLGTTAERLVRCGPVPVLLARGLREGPPRRILAAIDASDRADAVLAWARFLAHRMHAELAVCHVLSPWFLGRAQMVSGIQASRELEDRYRTQGEAWVREELARRLGDEDRYEVLVPIGNAGYEIIGAIVRGGFDLVVIGSRGESALAGGLLGSVVSAVLRGSTGPVLVVREDECGALPLRTPQNASWRSGLLLARGDEP